MNNGRNENGTFADGNPGGPGRPRRAVEREYLSALADAVPPDRWRRIVERAAADAEAGDGKARDWLARYLVGDNPPTLLALAADESRGRTTDEAIAQCANERDIDARMAERTASLLDVLAKR